MEIRSLLAEASSGVGNLVVFLKLVESSVEVPNKRSIYAACGVSIKKPYIMARNLHAKPFRESGEYIIDGYRCGARISYQRLFRA